MSTDQTTQLDDHRKMLTLSKQLSSFQLENLKGWPFVVFPDIKKSEVEYSFIDNEEMFYAGEVIFKVELDSELNKEEILKRSTFLSDWTKVLFWTDTKVEVHVNGKRINDNI